MRENLRLYTRYISIALRGQMQYRASFLMSTLSTLFMGALEYFGIWSLFDRFDNLHGWTLPEAAILYGIVNTAFSISEMTACGFDTFSGLIRSGDFDRFLLRPRSVVLQILGQDLKLMRVGRFFQGLAVLGWGMHAVGIDWTLPRLGLLIASTGAGACLFMGLLILQATMCFWTVESLEMINVMTYGGAETAQYPISIYKNWMRNFFTFVVPIACVSYHPTLAILGRTSGPNILPWLSPLIGILFLLVTLQVWKIGVRHYCSTGS